MLAMQACGIVLECVHITRMIICLYSREAFFAYCRTRGGYSGVATFCRADVAMPVAALDGFSGIYLVSANDFLHRPNASLPTIPDLEHLPYWCKMSVGRHTTGNCAVGILSQTHPKAKVLPPLSDAQELLSRPCAGLYERCAHIFLLLSLLCPLCYCCVLIASSLNSNNSTPDLLQCHRCSLRAFSEVSPSTINWLVLG